MLRSEVEQVNQIAKEIASESVGAATAVFAARIADLEMKIKKLSDAVEKFSKPVKQKGGLE